MAILAATGRVGSIVGQFANAALIEASVTELLVFTSGVMLLGSLCAGCVRDTTGLSMSEV
jgi:hypothetical protein